MNFKHGLTATREYESWKRMRKACLKPRHHNYAYYGGRGIKICEQWTDFNTFLRDMGLRPPGMTLERRDVNGDYEPANCYWATPLAQARNRRRTLRVTFACKTVSLKEACEMAGISYFTMWQRMRTHKLTFYQALASGRV